MKNNRLMRPSAALFPLALFAAEWITGETLPSLLLVFYFALQIFSLCAVDCFRNAAAREPGPRKADKRFWGSFPMLVFAPVALIAGLILIGGKIEGENILFVLIPWLIIIEQLFEERLFTLNRRGDGSLLALIANGLLFAGLMLDGKSGVPKPFELCYTLGASTAGLLIAVLTSLVIAPPKGFSLVPRNIGFAPKAMVQTLLYPAVCLAYLLVPLSSGYSLFPYLAGFALWRLSRTVCRRSADESRPLNLLLITVNAVVIAGAGFVPVLAEAAHCMMTALICALIVFLRPGWRNLTGTALLIASFACIYMEIEYAAYIAAACALIAIIINMKNAFLMKK